MKCHWRITVLKLYISIDKLQHTHISNCLQTITRPVPFQIFSATAAGCLIEAKSLAKLKSGSRDICSQAAGLLEQYQTWQICSEDQYLKRVVEWL